MSSAAGSLPDPSSPEYYGRNQVPLPRSPSHGLNLFTGFNPIDWDSAPSRFNGNHKYAFEEVSPRSLYPRPPHTEDEHEEKGEEENAASDVDGEEDETDEERSEVSDEEDEENETDEEQDEVSDVEDEHENIDEEQNGASDVEDGTDQGQKEEQDKDDEEAQKNEGEKRPARKAKAIAIEKIKAATARRTGLANQERKTPGQSPSDPVDLTSPVPKKRKVARGRGSEAETVVRKKRKTAGEELNINRLSIDG